METFTFPTIQFTNREMASGIWTCIFIAACLTNKGVRASFLKLIKTTFSRVLIPVYILMGFYAYLEVGLFSKIGLWETSLIKELVYWFFGTAFVMLMNSASVGKGGNYFGKTLMQSFGMSVFIEFLAELHSFSVAVEVLFIPIVTLLALMNKLSTLKKYETQLKPIKSISTVLVSTYGMTVLWHSVKGIFAETQTFWSFSTLRDFLFCPLMTVGFLPFIYGSALYATYGSMFVILGWVSKPGPELVRKAKWKVFWYANFNLWKLKTFWRRNSYKILNFKTDQDIKLLVVFDEQSTDDQVVG